MLNQLLEIEEKSLTYIRILRVMNAIRNAEYEDTKSLFDLDKLKFIF